MRCTLVRLILPCLAVCAHAAESSSLPGVAVRRVPNGGIQPQAVMDSAGILHLIYFTGDPAGGNIHYVTSSDAGETFSAPLRVNSQPGSAVALGNIRGARMALGRKGSVHVAWNGSSRAAPMLYAHLNHGETGFSPQQNLIHFASGLDGGGAVAAGNSGDVYVFWHAPVAGGTDEAARRVWVARSHDDGAHFEAERIAWDKPVGACGCCGLNAYADRRGHVYVLFRSASEMVHRDIYLLESRDGARTFEGRDISPWNAGYCVMSAEAFTESSIGVSAAWESQKQVYWSRLDPTSGNLARAIAPPADPGNRKYPALAANSKGQTLLAWTEGMGWKKGGSLAWQIFDDAGRTAGETGRQSGVPPWDLVAAVARPDGSFLVLY